MVYIKLQKTAVYLVISKDLLFCISLFELFVGNGRHSNNTCHLRSKSNEYWWCCWVFVLIYVCYNPIKHLFHFLISEICFH